MRAYFPEDDALSVNLVEVLKTMIGSLNFEPEPYEDNLRDAEGLADKLGIELDPDDIPAMEKVERRRGWGLELNQDNTLARLKVNCDLAGVHHIADAARLVDALLAPV